jgi:hypothetical protein
MPAQAGIFLPTWCGEKKPGCWSSQPGTLSISISMDKREQYTFTCDANYFIVDTASDFTSCKDMSV